MASLLCRHNADLPIERLIETLEHAMVHAGTSAASRNLAEINERGLVAKMMPPGLQEVSALIPHFTPAPRSFVLELRHECPPHSGCPHHARLRASRPSHSCGAGHSSLSDVSGQRNTCVWGWG